MKYTFLIVDLEPFIHFPDRTTLTCASRFRIESLNCSQWAALVRYFANKRPIVVIEFVSRDRSNDDFLDDAANPEPGNPEPVGRGTEFERALGLASFLVGPVAVRCKTVGYCSRDLEGHAVLVALACEEIAMSSKAWLGRIAIDDAAIDGVVVDAYQAIAKRRQNIPADAVTSMLDRDAGLFRVKSIGGRVEFLSQARLEEKRIAGDVLRITQ